MTDDRRTRRVSHPILRLEVLLPDGTRRVDYRVFCRYQSRSVSVGTCCACSHCDKIVATPMPSVDCTIPADETQDSMGNSTPVGSVLTKGAVAATSAITIGEALALLHDSERLLIAVVDDSSAMIGVVHDSASQQLQASNVAVTQSMSAKLALDEGTPVRRALERLAVAHLREAVVVDGAGVPLGVFRDLDGLHWIVAARRS